MVADLDLLELLLLGDRDIYTDRLLPRRVHLSRSQEKHVSQYLSDVCGRL